MSANPPAQYPQVNPSLPPGLVILPLPEMLRGVSEVCVYLRLPEDFVATWVDNEAGTIPAMPHFLLGGTKVFRTSAVLAWLAEYHGYGGAMRSVGKRPVLERKRRKNPFTKGKAGEAARAV